MKFSRYIENKFNWLGIWNETRAFTCFCVSGKPLMIYCSVVLKCQVMKIWKFNIWKENILK